MYSKVYNKRFRREQYHSVPDMRLKTIFRNSLRQALRDNCNSFVIKYIGLPTIEDLKDHLFLTSIINDYKDYNPEKPQRKYHIDHIKPLWLFDFTNEKDIFEAYHWSNLQILSSIDNINKQQIDRRKYCDNRTLCNKLSKEIQKK